ncbi:hypothetical protein ACQY0O_004529 [Thecaphora frezii]
MEVGTATVEAPSSSFDDQVGAPQDQACHGVASTLSSDVAHPPPVAGTTSTRLTASSEPIHEPINENSNVIAASLSAPQQREHSAPGVETIGGSADPTHVIERGNIGSGSGTAAGANVEVGGNVGTDACVGADVEQTGRPPAKGRRKRAATSMPIADDPGLEKKPPVRRSKRVKQEIDYSEQALSAAASGSANAETAAVASAKVPSSVPSKRAASQHATDAKPQSHMSSAAGGKGKAKAKAKAGAEQQLEEVGAIAGNASATGSSKGEGKATAKGKAAAREATDAAKKPRQRKANPANAFKEEVQNDPTLQNMPKEIKDRIIRVLSQRMFMINRFRAAGTLKEEFDVLGSTGDVYKVTIASEPKCTCMDNRIRKKLCKHLLFIFLKVLRLPRNSPMFLQNGMSHEQLVELFEAARPNPIEEGAQASKELRRAWEVSVGLRLPGQEFDDEGSDGSKAVKEEEKEASDPLGKRLLPLEGDSCPICYEDLEAASTEGLTFCLSSCGRPVHDDCFQQWCRSKGGLERGHVTCVWCRAAWPVSRATPKGPSASQLQENGYGIGMFRGAVRAFGQSRGVLNLADVAGVSKQRDTSTYR